MKIQIKNRVTGGVLLEGEAESVKELIKKNQGANLSEANLSRADLSKADLWGANLRGAIIANSQKEDLLKALNVIIKD